MAGHSDEHGNMMMMVMKYGGDGDDGNIAMMVMAIW